MGAKGEYGGLGPTGEPGPQGPPGTIFDFKTDGLQFYKDPLFITHVRRYLKTEDAWQALTTHINIKIPTFISTQLSREESSISRSLRSFTITKTASQFYSLRLQTSTNSASLYSLQQEMEEISRQVDTNHDLACTQMQKTKKKENQDTNSDLINQLIEI